MVLPAQPSLAEQAICYPGLTSQPVHTFHTYTSLWTHLDSPGPQQVTQDSCENFHRSGNCLADLDYLELLLLKVKFNLAS